MKKIFLIFTVVLLCMCCVGCSKKTNNTDSKPLDNEIVLNTNGGVPYNWNYEISDSSIVIFDDLKSIDKDPGVDGGVVELRYTFRGLREGKATIKFIYKSFVDNDVAEEKLYDVVVSKDLSVKVTEKK